MATHSSIPAWRIPWTVACQTTRVEHDIATTTTIGVKSLISEVGEIWV